MDRVEILELRLAALEKEVKELRRRVEDPTIKEMIFQHLRMQARMLWIAVPFVIAGAVFKALTK